MRGNLVGIAVAAAAAHLAAVTIAVTKIPLPKASVAVTLFDVYSAYSGADNSYGFFAPGVASEWRAALDSYDPVEDRWTTRTRPAQNRELAVLDSTISSHFSREDLRETLAASWGGKAIAERPEAAIVVVRAEAFLLPTMKQHRQGARGSWRTLAAYAFTTAARMKLGASENAVVRSR